MHAGPARAAGAVNQLGQLGTRELARRVMLSALPNLVADIDTWIRPAVACRESTAEDAVSFALALFALTPAPSGALVLVPVSLRAEASSEGAW